MKHEMPRIPFLDLDLLQTLVAIAETGSFSAAAAEVGRTPSAISMQVKKVEDMLDRSLFSRDTRRVTPTPDGNFLVEHARRMLAMNRSAMARFVAPEVEGVVRMGTPDDVAERFVPDMLRRFSCSHPGVSVDVLQGSSQDMLGLLERGEADLVLVTTAHGASPHEVLLTERLVWAMLDGGCAAERRPLPVSAWNEGCFWRSNATNGLDEIGMPWRLVFQSPHTSAQRAAVLADLAVAPLSVGSLGGGVVEAPERMGLPPLIDYDICLAVAEDAGPAVRAAADHLRASFRQVR